MNTKAAFRVSTGKDLYYEIHGCKSLDEAMAYAFIECPKGVKCFYFFDKGRKTHEFENCGQE